ncbi:MAG: hypothetical protein JWO56_408, partial [Acidobacteria bacterium]|nr:hypothetical protein [Acidobacteriota bacterium]
MSNASFEMTRRGKGAGAPFRRGRINFHDAALDESECREYERFFIRREVRMIGEKVRELQCPEVFLHL